MNFDIFEYSNHALVKAIERNIEIDEIERIVEKGELIKEYPNDRPYPSYLILGYIETLPVHVVIAANKKQCIVIMVYVPDSNIWDKDYKTKK